MFRSEAIKTLDELTRVRRASRRALGYPWRAVLGFGAATILAPAVALAGPDLLAVYWATVGIAATCVLRVLGGHRMRRRGVREHSRVWRVATAMYFIAVAIIAFAWTYGAETGLIASMAVVLLGHVILGLLRRDPVTPVVVTPAAAFGIGACLLHARLWTVELLFGIGLIVAALALRHIERRHP